MKTVDYTSVPSIVAALQGQDALVSAMAFETIEVQKVLIDAAVQAGVRRMIPSEYGCDTKNPKLASIPIYLPKIAIREYLDQKVVENPAFSYTIVMNSSFLAPGWTLNFIVDVNEKKCLIKDGGDVLFSAATLPAIGQSIIGILTHVEETANRPVKIKSVDSTQNELIAMARKIDPTATWDIRYASTHDLEKEAHERWNNGDHSPEVVEKFINRAFLGKGYGGQFPETDNELLGIEELDKRELEELVRTAMRR